MSKPIIEFWVKEDNEWKELESLEFGDIDAGDGSDPETVYVWNNRNGSSHVPDMINCRVTTRNIDGGKEGEPIEKKWIKARIEDEEEFKAIGGDTIKYIGVGESPDMLSEDRRISGKKNDGTLDEEIEMFGEKLEKEEDGKYYATFAFDDEEEIKIFVNDELLEKNNTVDVEEEELEYKDEDGKVYATEYDIVEETLKVFVNDKEIEEDNIKFIEQEKLSYVEDLGYKTKFDIYNQENLAVYLNGEKVNDEDNIVEIVGEKPTEEDGVYVLKEEPKEDPVVYLDGSEIDKDSTKTIEEELESKDGYEFETNYQINEDYSLTVFVKEDEIDKDQIAEYTEKELETEDGITFEIPEKALEDSIEIFIDGEEANKDAVLEIEEELESEDNLIFELSETPVAGSVTVYVDEEEIEEGYSVDYEDKTIEFEEETEDKVKVEYQVENGYVINFEDEEIVFDREQEGNVAADYQAEDGYEVIENKIVFDQNKENKLVEVEYTTNDGYELVENTIEFDLEKDEEVTVDYLIEVDYSTDYEDSIVTFEEDVSDFEIALDYKVSDGFEVDYENRTIEFEITKKEGVVKATYTGKDGYSLNYSEGSVDFDKSLDEDDEVTADYIGIKEQNFVPLELKCRIPEDASSGNHQFYTRVSYQFTD